MVSVFFTSTKIMFTYSPYICRFFEPRLVQSSSYKEEKIPNNCPFLRYDYAVSMLAKVRRTRRVNCITTLLFLLLFFGAKNRKRNCNLSSITLQRSSWREATKNIRVWIYLEFSPRKWSFARVVKRFYFLFFWEAIQKQKREWFWFINDVKFLVNFSTRVVRGWEYFRWYS